MCAPARAHAEVVEGGGCAVSWHVTEGEERGSQAKQSTATNDKERVGEGLSPNCAYLRVIWWPTDASAPSVLRSVVASRGPGSVPRQLSVPLTLATAAS